MTRKGESVGRNYILFYENLIKLLFIKNIKLKYQMKKTTYFRVILWSVT